MRPKEVFGFNTPFGERSEETQNRIPELLDEALESNQTDVPLQKLQHVRQLLASYAEYELASQNAYHKDAAGNPRTPRADQLEAKRRAEQKLQRLL